MRYIQKTNEPNSLVEHREKKFATYDNLPSAVKDELKEYLLSEQGNICCYCMKRIDKNNMKIEHLKSQSANPDLTLNYKNMLAACNGNEGNPRHLQCCDTHKGDIEISINPLLQSNIDTIRFLNNGAIESINTEYNKDINDTLNLNMQSLQNNLKRVIEVVIDYMRAKYPNKQWNRSIIEKEIKNWENKDSSGKLKEYSEVVIYKLKKLKNR